MEQKFIDINGNQVMDLTPDYNRPLALVDLQVLNKLTDLLGKTDFSSIRHGLRNKIMNTKSLEELVQVTEDFTAFHQSVNLIREVTSNEVTEEPVGTVREDGTRIVGRINLDGTVDKEEMSI
jgi:hypothetical protein